MLCEVLFGVMRGGRYGGGEQGVFLLIEGVELSTSGGEAAGRITVESPAFLLLLHADLLLFVWKALPQQYLEDAWMTPVMPERLLMVMGLARWGRPSGLGVRPHTPCKQASKQDGAADRQRQTDRRTDRQTDRQSETDRPTETDRDRDTDRDRKCIESALWSVQWSWS